MVVKKKSEEKATKAAPKKKKTAKKKIAKDSAAKKTSKAKPTKKSSTKKSASDSVQPELNIALMGHVDHGKTTLTERFSGKWTDTHSEELKKGITIRLGYADFTIHLDEENDFYTTKPKSIKSNKETKILRKISLVDSPGHESLMATMLSGAAIVDGAILMVAANERCPQPQTREHLMALQISGIKNIIVVQNKIDLVDAKKAKRNYEQIKEFLKGTDYEKVPIVPISARANVNIDELLRIIEEKIPTPKRENNNSLMLVARSFDINKPGTKINKITGGVLGGTVQSGSFKVGETIEIVPGYMVQEKNQRIWKPLTTTITQIFTGSQPVETVHAGGSMALATTLDPSIVKSDALSGSLVGLPGTLPKVHYQIKIDTHLLDRVLGTKEELEVKPLARKEMLLLNVYSTTTVGVVIDPSKKNTIISLRLPIAANPGDRITISRKIGDRFRLIGYGILK